MLAAIPKSYRDQVDAFHRIRRIDPCAMHDVAAAERASGDQGDEIGPRNDGLNQCVLRLTRGEFTGSWALYLDAGAGYGGDRRQRATPDAIAGQQVYLEPDDDGAGCTLARPLDDKYAITLRARSSGTTKDAPSIQPCDLVRAYVTAAASRWTTPPLREANLTTPALTLAATDPCVAASALLADFGDGATLIPSAPYRCTVQPGPGRHTGTTTRGVEQDATITLGVGEDPLSALTTATGNGSQYSALTVGGLQAVVSKDRGSCTITIVYDPQTVITSDGRTPDKHLMYQTVGIRAGACDQAQSTADRVMAKVVTP